MPAGDIAQALRDGGEDIRRRAAANAATWSVRVPPSGRVTSLSENSVHIIFGSEVAPMAYPFELGIRHPLWATGPRSTWDWGPTPHRPFLAPAANEGLDKAADELLQLAGKWADEMGLNTE